MPATCEVCKREMVEGGGCVAAAIKVEGQFYERLRYDSEAERACFTEADVGSAVMPMRGDASCHGCGAAIGALHHVGCDMERCPRCRRQLIMCDCEVER